MNSTRAGGAGDTRAVVAHAGCGGPRGLPCSGFFRHAMYIALRMCSLLWRVDILEPVFPFRGERRTSSRWRNRVRHHQLDVSAATGFKPRRCLFVKGFLAKNAVLEGGDFGERFLGTWSDGSLEPVAIVLPEQFG